jgi:hypothetical protein
MAPQFRHTFSATTAILFAGKKGLKESGLGKVFELWFCKLKLGVGGFSTNESL